MRPTGRLHLGHYHGALKNWAKLQHEYPCFFFVADWHALTTHYETPEVIEAYTYELVIDYIAAGIDPAQATLFAQSKVPAHAELTLLLSPFVAAIGALFPGRDCVGLMADAVLAGGGGFHCASQQMPAS